MITLNSESIKDFQVCERLYDYRYVQKMPETIYSRDLYTQKFENSIKNIIHFFWFKKQGGITPSYSSLLNRWEKIWFPKETNHYDIITEQHESAYGNVASLTTQAAGILLRFHEEYSDSNIIPISISEEFAVNINSNIRVQDTIDIIYRLDNKNYVIKFLFNYKNNQKYMYQVDFCVMYLLFKNHFPERIKETKFGYIDLFSNNLFFNQYKINQEDISSIEYWCDTMYSKTVFVPRRGLTSYCKKCPFDTPCSKWSGWNG